MKIRKLLKNLNPYTYIKILEYIGSEDYEILWKGEIKILEYVGPEDWEVLWKGEVYNCPWDMADGIVDTIFLDTIEDGSPCLCIYKKKCDQIMKICLQ